MLQPACKVYRYQEDHPWSGRRASYICLKCFPYKWWSRGKFLFSLVDLKLHFNQAYAIVLLKVLHDFKKKGTGVEGGLDQTPRPAPLEVYRNYRRLATRHSLKAKYIGISNQENLTSFLVLITRKSLLFKCLEP